MYRIKKKNKEYAEALKCTDVNTSNSATHSCGLCRKRKESGESKNSNRIKKEKRKRGSRSVYTPLHFTDPLLAVNLVQFLKMYNKRY